MNWDYNAGIMEAILRLYDCDEHFARSTRAQGLTVIKNAYMSILGLSTPSALKKFLQNEFLWNNGFWPRFAILSPETKVPEWIDQFSFVERPASITEVLRKLYMRLPAPKYPDLPKAIEVAWSEDAQRGWHAYNRALTYTLLDSGMDDRLASAYGRLPIMQLKVAMILAGLDWSKEDRPVITLADLARAQQITEGWRQSLHRVLTEAEECAFEGIRKRIVQFVASFGSEGVSMRDIFRNNRNMRPAELEYALNELSSIGDLEVNNITPGRSGGRPTKKYRIPQKKG